MFLIRIKQSSVPDCHSSFDRNSTSLIIYMKNIPCVLLAENECIFHVTRVQCCGTSANYIQRSSTTSRVSPYTSFVL